MFITLLAGTIITTAVKAAAAVTATKVIFNVSQMASENITRKVLK